MILEMPQELVSGFIEIRIKTLATIWEQRVITRLKIVENYAKMEQLLEIFIIY